MTGPSLVATGLSAGYDGEEILIGLAPITAEGITVADLVSRGRHPRKSLFSWWTRRDDEAMDAARLATKTFELDERPVDELSRCQRQRVWIAMALAQETAILMLDEPTTFLNISHQIDVLDLVTDLNLAARFADDPVAMAGERSMPSAPPKRC